MAIAREAGSSFVLPGQHDADADYPLARTFDFVVPPRAAEDRHSALLEFLSSVLELEAQAMATTAGYSPLTSDQRTTALDRVTALAVGLP